MRALDLLLNSLALLQPVEADPVLGEHPDLTLSPVIKYQIQRAKEDTRLLQRRQALAAEGLSEEEITAQLEVDALTGGGGGKGKETPLALMIRLGARVEATKGGASAEQALIQARKREQRNVDQFLLKVQGIEKYKDEKGTKASRDIKTGERIKSAHEVARDSAFVRVGGSKAQREETSAKRVKSQRQLLRDWGSVPENAKILEEYAANNKEEKARRQAKATGRETYAGGGTNALGLTEDIAALLEAELEAEEGEEGEEGDEEGEEGEEGEELDA